LPEFCARYLGVEPGTKHAHLREVATVTKAQDE
jgi:hypothetical protein